jgi:hypothetical protein
VNLYAWSVWLHILFAFIFFFAHGTSMAIAFLLPQEKDPVRMRALLDVSAVSVAPLGISLFVLLITSLHMGLTAGWIRTGWWCLSFLLMLGTVAWMTWYSRNYYTPIRKALGGFYMSGLSTKNPAVEDKAVNWEEVQELVRRTNPHLLASVGLIVTALLIWLMRVKPF